jgi:hypothetical protein
VTAVVADAPQVHPLADFICAAIISAMVVAQQAPGVVTGTVLDQNGNPVTLAS